LSELICDAIGDNWIRDLDELKKLESFVNDSTFCERWRQVKHENKQDFSEYLKKTLRTEVSRTVSLISKPNASMNISDSFSMPCISFTWV
jgi:glucan phosphorylase